jgi:hypothetical protein
MKSLSNIAADGGTKFPLTKTPCPLLWRIAPPGLSGNADTGRIAVTHTLTKLRQTDSDTPQAFRISISKKLIVLYGWELLASQATLPGIGIA